MANSDSSFHPPFESAREHIRAQPAPALLAAPRGSDNEKWQLRNSSGKISRAAAQKELGSALVRAGEVMGNAGCFPSFSLSFFFFFWGMQPGEIKGAKPAVTLPSPTGAG